MTTYSVPAQDVHTVPDKRTWHFFNFIAKHLAFTLREEKDVVFLSLLITLTAILLPFVIYFFVFGNHFSWIISGIYWFVWLNVTGPYILMLHATAHKQIFTKRYNFINFYIRHILGAFFGLTYQSYFSHHLIMHHYENNGLRDQSSTIQYRRDSFLHWLHYAFKFSFLGYFVLIRYLYRAQKYKAIKRVLLNDTIYYVALLLLALLNFHAAMTLFIFPLVAIRPLLMMGNWGQHAFIDITDSENAYKYSVTLINTPFNAACFNDGYHVVHHEKPGLSWLDMPNIFHKNLELYVINDAIIFTGVKGGFTEVWYHLMRKRYDVLADKMPEIGIGSQSREQKIAFLKKRVQEYIKE